MISLSQASLHQVCLIGIFWAVHILPWIRRHVKEQELKRCQIKRPLDEILRERRRLDLASDIMITHVLNRLMPELFSWRMEGILSDLSREKIKQSIEDRKRLHVSFLNHVKTYEAFLKLEEKAFRDGTLSKKTKELMALSVSIVTKCEPCMEWHLDQAMQSGAIDEEIYETIDVAIEMGGGQAGAYARFVLIAMEFLKEKKGRRR